MIILPAGNFILYIQPVYLSSATYLKIPELKRLIVSQGDVVVMAPSLEEAFQDLEDKLKVRIERQKKRFPVPQSSAPQTPAPKSPAPSSHDVSNDVSDSSHPRTQDEKSVLEVKQTEPADINADEPEKKAAVPASAGQTDPKAGQIGLNAGETVDDPALQPGSNHPKD